MSMSRNRFRSAMALAVPCIGLMALCMATATGATRAHALAVTSGRYCYNWDFINNTPQDANDLHIGIGGVSQVGSWYTGSQNPFGLPNASSGYDATAGVYRANFGGGLALQGEAVHIGFCADRPALQVSNAAWTVDGAAVAPAPLAANVRFTQVSPTQIRVELSNPQPSGLLLLSFNVLDAFDGLPLDDLNGQIASQLSALGEPLLYPEVLPAGRSKTFDVFIQVANATGMQAQSELAEQAATIEEGHALVVEALLAAEDDEGNAVHVFAQMLPPSKQFMPLVRKP